MTRRLTVLSLVALLAPLPALAACPAGQTQMLHTRLYFGLTMNGRPIADSDWSDFLVRSVTPRFSSGFTVYEATGQWRDRSSGAMARERTRVIEIAAPDTPRLRAAAQAVRREYRERFHQQSVGIITSPACAAF